jgi:hypothetical protein
VLVDQHTWPMWLDEIVSLNTYMSVLGSTGLIWCGLWVLPVLEIHNFSCYLHSIALIHIGMYRKIFVYHG